MAQDAPFDLFTDTTNDSHERKSSISYNDDDFDKFLNFEQIDNMSPLQEDPTDTHLMSKMISGGEAFEEPFDLQSQQNLHQDLESFSSSANQSYQPQDQYGFQGSNFDIDTSIATSSGNYNAGLLNSQYFSPRIKPTVGRPGTAISPLPGTLSTPQVTQSATGHAPVSHGSSTSEAIKIASPPYDLGSDAGTSFGTPFGTSFGAESYNSLDNSYIKSPSFKGSLGSPGTAQGSLSSKSALNREEKMRRRREFHNAVERRRRDLIKEKIKELGSLIPPPFLYDRAGSNKELKANKSVILSKTLQYIEKLSEIKASQDIRLKHLRECIDLYENIDTGNNFLDVPN
ncbi:Transcription factor [Komagataella phaffii CBS 7435]|uniref:Transcription factor n=1 Tax=Komagataella phaffii (strain ATCC 76273 / CBS 7435 / CECT 11047 / NRRL Y-11430 / Wegner 21-1) TaxID=981350 RepID=F2QXT2_KOMPC|nr:GQ67_05318T0 [Komagataella phaffii]AOA70166.1 GQ68_05295T0 [Komagataella phaffii GS115]CAH2450411.1 Transcription factor [Komagataella phaffii CBS 7435]CCA40210.1 Transcription factor [Komagataella phaffii CBS 7435]